MRRQDGCLIKNKDVVHPYPQQQLIEVFNTLCNYKVLLLIMLILEHAPQTKKQSLINPQCEKVNSHQVMGEALYNLRIDILWFCGELKVFLSLFVILKHF